MKYFVLGFYFFNHGFAAASDFMLSSIWLSPSIFSKLVQMPLLQDRSP